MQTNIIIYKIQTILRYLLKRVAVTIALTLIICGCLTVLSQTEAVAAPFAYVASGGTVLVIDPNEESPIGPNAVNIVDSINVTGIITSMAKSYDDSTVYVATQSNSTVTAINTATNTVVATIPVGDSLKGIAVSPDGSLVYVTNELDGTVYVIDTASQTVVDNIPVGNRPWDIAASPDGSRVYVANEFSENYSVIDTTTNAVVASVPSLGIPYGVTVSSDSSYAIVSEYNQGLIWRIDTATNTRIPGSIGTFVPFGGINNLLIAPGRTTGYLIDGLQFISTVDVNTFSRTGGIDLTGVLALDETVVLLGISPDASTLYAITEESFGATYNFIVIDLNTNQVVGYLALFGVLPNLIFKNLVVVDIPDNGGNGEPPTVDDLFDLVDQLNTSDRSKNILRGNLNNILTALNNGNNKIARGRVANFILRLVNRSNFRESNANRIPLDEANNLAVAASNYLTTIALE